MFATKLQHFPNREVRATFYTVPGQRKKRDRTTDSQERASKSLPESVPPDDGIQPAAPLVITSEFRDGCPAGVSRLKPGFGGDARPTKFGNYARRKLLRSGASMESLPGGFQRCLFLTGTLPGSTHDAMDAIARYSSFIIDRLKTWLSDNGASSYSSYVWERQKRGALHLHYCVYIPPTEKGNRITDGFKTYWYKLLSRVSKESGVDLFARKKGGSWNGNISVLRAEAVWCRKSIAAYLSKYLGKSANQIGGASTDAAYYPVRWWGISRPLNALLRTQTYEQIFYSSRRRDALIFYNDIAGWLTNTSDKCYSYTHRYTGSCVTVAYNPYYKGEQIWELMRTQRQKASASKTSSDCMVSTTIRLRSIMNRYYLRSRVLSQMVSPYCGQVAESAFKSGQLSITEAMELAHGLHFLLSSKYRDRLHQPRYLSEDLDWLESNLASMLEIRRTARQQGARKDGIHG